MHSDSESEEAENLLPLDSAPEASPDENFAPPEDTPSDELNLSEEPASTEGPFSSDEPLAALAAQAQQRRLAAADEERAGVLLKEALLGGRDGLAKAIEFLPKLPWVVGVNAVAAVWQEMKPTMRTRLLAGLARADSEAARRMRLSLARGLFKQDVPASLKIAISVAKDMREKEGPPISSKNAHIFANVFVGRAKPWVALLPLADLKPAEADLLVQIGVSAVFVVPHPPAAQVGILKWAAVDGRLGRVAPEALDLVVRAISRWSPKWRQVLQREAGELPPTIIEALKLETRAPARPVSDDAGAGTEETTETPANLPVAGDDGAEPDSTASADADENGEAPRRDAPRQRPVYESKTVPRREAREPRERESRPAPEYVPREPRAFNLGDTLRQVEHYVTSLKNDLQQAQTRLRQREDDGRRGRREERSAPVAIAGAPSADELARLNQQLELRNAELQARLDELRDDAEIRAASAGDTEPAHESAQLRTLLALKLQDDFADFQALEAEAPDQVVKQHYPVLLRHIFEILLAEGIALSSPPSV